MRFITSGTVASILLPAVLGAWLAPAQTPPGGDPGWPTYSGGPGGERYSPLSADQPRERGAAPGRLDAIAPARWAPGRSSTARRAFEATPVLAGGKLFLTTPYSHVIALDPATGAKAWEFDPKLDLSHGYSEVTSRGVAAWTDAAARAGQPCALSIFVGTLDGRLIALDGASGKPCAGFGSSGEVDLTRDVGFRDRGDYQVTSAPAIAGDLVIVGSSIGDNRRRGHRARHRARLRCAHAASSAGPGIPSRGPAGTQPRTGGGNAWSTISVDAARDLVFVPTGSASPDYFGGVRQGDNKWANSVVALRASTGELVWGFQVVHHDLWDYDVAAQPTLFDWKDGTPAIAVTTKMGRVFVLDRKTGAPLLPVEERPAPESDIPGRGGLAHTALGPLARRPRA